MAKNLSSTTQSRMRECARELCPNLNIRQGFPLPTVFLSYTIDWTMQRSLIDYPGVQLNPDVFLADLEFRNDVNILMKSWLPYSQL